MKTFWGWVGDFDESLVGDCWVVSIITVIVTCVWCVYRERWWVGGWMKVLLPIWVVWLRVFAVFVTVRRISPCVWLSGMLFFLLLLPTIFFSSSAIAVDCTTLPSTVYSLIKYIYFCLAVVFFLLSFILRVVIYLSYGAFTHNVWRLFFSGRCLFSTCLFAHSGELFSFREPFYFFPLLLHETLWGIYLLYFFAIIIADYTIAFGRLTTCSLHSLSLFAKNILWLGGEHSLP